MEKQKNVLITAQAYNFLINELGLKPSELLAKMNVEEDRIKSPKSNKFIHIGSNTYMKLLKEYKEEELLLRRDGFIHSPESTNLIRVFGKKFNQLLLKSEDKYKLENMLKLPRIQRGNDVTGVKYNDYFNQNNEKVNEKINILKETKKQHDEKKNEAVFEENLNKDNINHLIKKEPVVVFSSATLNQYDEENDVHSKCYYNAAGFFNQGKLSALYEAKELRDGIDTFDNALLKIYGDHTNIDQFHKYINDENEENIVNPKIESIDLFSIQKLTNKNYAIKILKEKYESQDYHYFNIASLHMWFTTHALLLNIIPRNQVRNISIMLKMEEDDQYEKFINTIETKEKMKKEIDHYYNQLLEYLSKD